MPGQGKLAEARRLAELAVDVVRKVGMTFIGPAVLAAKASLTGDPEESKNALLEAESILASGCVAHNHFFFESRDRSFLGDRRLGRGRALCGETRGLYTRPAFAMVRLLDRPRTCFGGVGRGMRSEAVLAELVRLHQVAVQHGLKSLASKPEDGRRQTKSSPLRSAGILH